MGETKTFFRFVTRQCRQGDPRSAGFLADAHALGLNQILQIQCADLYFIEGTLAPEQLQRLGRELLSDPVTESCEWQICQPSLPSQAVLSQGQYLVEVALRPGVTDPVAEQIVRAAHELGLSGLQRAATGLQFLVSGHNLQAADLNLLAQRLLANPIIQRFALGQIEPAFPQPAAASGKVEILPIQTMNDQELLRLSAERRAALDLNEMHAIQAYFVSENRACTDIEFEMIAQTWSEHCVHKTFRAMIDVNAPQPHPYPAQVNNILKTYIRQATQDINAPWVLSAFVDNAGIIEFDKDFEVSFKVETHNHPSAVEPFGGANTGVGGVIRDVLGVSAKPIANTDVLCFGMQNTSLDDLPEGVLHPRRIFSGVVSGVQDYGNKMGIPTVNGAIWYDPGYTANPLVYCGCVGLAPRGRHRRTPETGDHVIVLGGRTGRDGLRGATFSSMTMDAQTGEVSGASVQIGAPITEKIVTEVVLRARDAGLYSAITDCGAGGLSSAVGEMASQIGADVDLAQVALKYPGLAPWEIWLSEAQERMVLAVSEKHLPALQALCNLFDVELTDLGLFTGTGRLVVRYEQKVVLELANTFLHDGIPQRRLTAAPPIPPTASHIPPSNSIPIARQAIKRLIAHPNIASKEAVIRIYDHEVQGGTCVKPLTGPAHNGPSDACVLKPIQTPGSTGIVLSNGFNPEYGKQNAYNMAVSVIDEAVRNAVATGANPDRLAILDNFCWGDPLRPETMWTLLEAARGCYDAAILHQTPFISGKDSFNNEYLSKDHVRQSIPPSLLISAIGLTPDIKRAVTMDLKQAGNLLYLVGEFSPCFGGSHYAALFGQPYDLSDQVPAASLLAPRLYRAIFQVIQQGDIIRACHDISEGGLSVAASEMVIGGQLGAEINLPKENLVAWLFGETNGCFLVEVNAGQQQAFEQALAGLPIRLMGEVTNQNTLKINHPIMPAITLTIQELTQAWAPSQEVSE
jgi:phosphoribosylformylglycinamidine synthase